MKNLSLIVVAVLLLSLNSCVLAEGIFKAGMGVGILLILGVVAIFVYLFSKMRGR